MTKSIRAVLAVATFLVVSIALIIVSILLAGNVVYQVVNHMLPAISGVTNNTNTTADYTSIESSAFLLFAIIGGAIAAAWVYEPRLNGLLEKIIIGTCFVFGGSISAMNFAVDDQLIRVSAQAVLDFVFATSSIAVLVMLWGWNSRRPLLSAIRVMAIFGVSMFGVLLPTYFGAIYIAVKLGLPVSSLGDFSGWRDMLAGICSLTVTLTAVWSNRSGQNGSQSEN